MKKSLKEIEKDLEYILKTDTNNLISTTSNDKDVKNLAITLNKELRSLRKQRLQYENGNQELKKNITNVSHDLRTPLTAISGYVEMLKENDDTEKQGEYINIIENKTNDLVNLTEQLFKLSKTMDINENIDRKLQCLNEILEEALASYYYIFKEKNILPEIQIAKQKIYRKVDKNCVIRVFENILSNMIKYGNGEFRVCLNENGEIIFSNKAESLDVTTVGKIFDRYYTVENAKNSGGIGLSIAKQLVELNGGSIDAKYEKGSLYIKIVI